MKFLNIMIFTAKEIIVIVKEINCSENEEQIIKKRVNEKNPNFIITFFTNGMPQNMIEEKHIEKIIDGTNKAIKIEAEFISMNDSDINDCLKKIIDQLSDQLPHNRFKIMAYQNN